MKSDCQRTIDLLASYVDRLLTPEERAEVERHLHACPPCRQYALREEGGHAVLRHEATHLREQTLPPGLRTRCEALVREAAARTASAQPAAVIRTVLAAWRSNLVPTLLGILFIVFSASAVLAIATRRSDTLLAAQLTADHSKCFLTLGTPRANVDAREVEQMLRDDYGWNIHVPPSSAPVGVVLLGARRCLYADGLIPHVMYRVNGDELSLYVLNGVTRPAADLVSLGHRSHIWTRNTKTYVLVSSAVTDGLPDATEYMMNEAY